MRTSLFLSTLFAATLLGGSALAEKPAASGGAREPRAVERVRAHGDTVDKAYRGAEAGARPGASGTAARPGTAAPTRGRSPIDPGANRVNCSDSGVDCLAAKGKAPGHAAGGGDPAGHAARPPAFLDRILGSDRTNFNEAGESQGMSPRAANRAWASAAASSTLRGAGAELPMSAQRQVDRKSQQASDARMSCNEADECSMAIKAARKEWAKASIVAGTWKGPAKEPVSNAARRIAQQRAAEGATATAAERAAAKGHADAGEHADHPH